MDIDSSLATNMHYWWFCDDLTNARYLFILLCIVKSKFFTINVSIVDMRSLYYQLIVIVVCNAFAISVFFAVIYLFIILDVCEGPLIYGVLVKYVAFHPSVPGSSLLVIFMIFFCWRIRYNFSFLYVQGWKRIYVIFCFSNYYIKTNLAVIDGWFIYSIVPCFLLGIVVKLLL